MSETVNSIDNYGQQYEVPVGQLKWRPSAYGIVLKDNHVLLSPQFGENSFDLPGGGVELGESIEGAAVREVKEKLKKKPGLMWQTRNSSV